MPSLPIVHWAHGEIIWWCFRREVAPARVVSDDERGTVVWIERGTPVIRAGTADGRALRDRPLSEVFITARVFSLEEWRGDGILRIARPGWGYSAWMFSDWSGPDGLRGWYCNIETPLRRGPHSLHSRDQVLDVWMDASGGIQLKDEDELEVAAEVGRVDDPVAVRAIADRAIAHLQSRAWPFDGSFDDWKPDPGWELPKLPAKFTDLHGRPAIELFPEGSSLPGPYPDG